VDEEGSRREGEAARRGGWGKGGKEKREEERGKGKDEEEERGREEDREERTEGREGLRGGTGAPCLPLPVLLPAGYSGSFSWDQISEQTRRNERVHQECACEENGGVFQGHDAGV